jgi:hypothetical protein
MHPGPLKNLLKVPTQNFLRKRNQNLREERSGGVGSGDHVVVHDNCNVISGDITHAVLKKILITHFDVANRKGEVVWPRINGIVRTYHTASQR